MWSVISGGWRARKTKLHGTIENRGTGKHLEVFIFKKKNRCFTFEESFWEFRLRKISILAVLWNCPSSFTSTYSPWDQNFFPEATISIVRNALWRQNRTAWAIPFKRLGNSSLFSWMTHGTAFLSFLRKLWYECHFYLAAWLWTSLGTSLFSLAYRSPLL